MPLEFSNARKEHLHVRNCAGIFDVSHMGEIRIEGQEALVFLSRLLSNNTSLLKEGQCQYNLMCDDGGGIIDDLIVYCQKPGTNYLLCVNAGATAGNLQWIESHAGKFSVSITNESRHWGQIAVQGPKARKAVQMVFGKSILNIEKFHFNFARFENVNCLVSRTGYTGEDGFEILSPAKQTQSLWKAFFQKDLLEKGGEILPIGLAARDTLRMEMKYPLSGQDMDQSTNPYEMGLKWVCRNPSDFIGKSSLSKIKELEQRWTAFEMTEPSGIPRSGCNIYSPNNQLIGKVTSGALSPSLNKMIGLALLKKEFSQPNTPLYIEIHSKKAAAKVVSAPFIKK